MNDPINDQLFIMGLEDLMRKHKARIVWDEYNSRLTIQFDEHDMLYFCNGALTAEKLEVLMMERNFIAMSGDKIIQTLEPNEVFVFGSNQAGIHGAGAAKQAYKDFGATWGLGYGLSQSDKGMTFAIPTKDYDINTLPLTKIESYVKMFINFASMNSDMRFLLTKIGCGLAGYRDDQIAPMFKDAPENVIKPKGW